MLLLVLCVRIVVCKMMENKRKIDDDKVTSKPKRRGKNQPQFIPTPIPTPLVSKIGISSTDSINIADYPLDIFDFFMLPFSVILNDFNGSEKQLLPQIAPDASLLPKISEILLSIKSGTDSDWYAGSYLCIPSYASKKQQNVILVLEPPPLSSSSDSSSLSSSLLSSPQPTPFSSSLLLLLDKISPLFTNNVEIVVNINVGTAEGVQKEWHDWNSIYFNCNFHPKLFVGLSLKSLSLSETELRERWKGERLKLVNFHSSLVPSSDKFPPMLKKLLSHFSSVATYFTVKSELKDLDETKRNNLHNLYKYLSMRVVSRTKVYGLEESFLPYLDKPQVPLQPLEEDLTPEIYNVFEQCPVKYRKYQDAIYQTLRSKEAKRSNSRTPEKDKDKRDNNNNKSNGKEEKKEEREVVMIVGAGRGPLVLQTMIASQRARRPVRVYALDKNPHAIKAMQELQQRKKWDDDEVVIVDADMRDWNPPEQADILVSELLGSFGDNELSPECLDAAQKFLKPGGVSVPKQYTSFLAPVSSSPLYHEVVNIVQRVASLQNQAETNIVQESSKNNNGNNADKSCNSPINLTSELHRIDNIIHPTNIELNEGNVLNDQFNSNNNNNNNNNSTLPQSSTSTQTTTVRSLQIPADYYFEVGYVVKFHNVLFLDNSQRCFTFSHPNPEVSEGQATNTRYIKLVFTPKMDGVLHGFAGFFEAFLHDKISFSTNPPNNDSNLVAWFPMFFPLKKPTMVYQGESFEVHFWRKCSSTKVWYEWCMGSPDDPSVFIYNVNGRAYSMKL